MTYKQIPMVQVLVDDLRLDLDNYRIPVRPDDEDAALKYLFASEDVIDQIRLFLRDGYFDNEVPIVVKEGTEYVVLEGNRRVSALKAIQKPDVVPEHEHAVRELLTRYAAEVNSMPTKIRVLVSPDRNSARPHIARLHTGISKKRWSRDQQANYYYSLLGPSLGLDDLKALYPGVDVVRFLRMVQMRHFLDGVKYDDKSLHDYVRSDKLTMSAFEYAYRPKVIASAMGVVFDGYRLVPTNLDPRKIGASLTGTKRAAVEYLMEGFRADRFNTRSPAFKKDSEAQEKLLERLLGTADADAAASDAEPDAESVADSDFDDETKGHADNGGESSPDDSGTDMGGAMNSGGVGAGATGGGRESAGRGQGGPNDPDTLKGLPLGDAPSNLVRRYLELRKIDVAKTPAAAGMLLRSVLESTIKFHFSGTSKATSGELGTVLPVVVAEYGGRRTHRDVLNTISNGPVGKPGSLKWFNAAAHNPDFPITERDVREAHSLVESVFKLLLKPYSP